MLEVIFKNEIPGLDKNNVLYIDHIFCCGNISEKIPGYDDCVKRIEKETEIRVWYSDYPSELSGFYWLCKLLTDISYKGNVYIEKSCKEFDGERYGLETTDVLNVKNTRNPLSPEKIRESSTKWQKLCAENSEVRIVRNNELVSDFPNNPNGLTESELIVLKTMKDLDITIEKSKKAAQIIGTVLGKYPKIMNNDFTVFTVMKKLSEKQNLLIDLIPDPEEIQENYDSSNDYRCFECKFTEAGYSIV